MIRAIFAALLVTGLAIAAPSAAREPNRQPPPVARSVSRPPPYSDPALARAQFARHCGANTVSEGVVNLPAGTRLGFAADPGEPARLVLCIDQAKVALAFPVASIEEALVFMAYKPFAPFWPAAEARWGNDMAILREEVRRKPIEQALADYAYAAMIPPETAAVIAASRTAGAAGDHAKALALVEDEVVRLAAANRAAQNGRGGAREGSAPQFGFDMSLLILRIGNLVANAEGPSAGADRIAALLAQYRLDPDYLSLIHI